MDLQNIAFRTDANNRIGTGHFMRCLTLADILSKRGARIRFLSRGLLTYLRDMLATKGIELMSLESEESQVSVGDLAHAHWLNASQMQDARDTVLALSDRRWDWLIVDHYSLDMRWESIMRNVTNQIMVIDDIADRRHDCDVLLDQNFYLDMQTRYIDKVPAHCQLLLGPRYALLREEFSKLHKQVKPRSGRVQRILVFFGGVDVDNCTGRVIEALGEMGAEGVHVDVVIGAQHPCSAEIEANCATHGFVCHVQTNRMAELMAAADLAIGAGGSASWERCCLGLPALLVSLADNQIEIAKALDLSGCCLYLGPHNKLSASIMQSQLTDLLCNHDKIEIISKQAFFLVDGQGDNRVCQALGY